MYYDLHKIKRSEKKDKKSKRKREREKEREGGLSIPIIITLHRPYGSS